MKTILLFLLSFSCFLLSSSKSFSEMSRHVLTDSITLSEAQLFYEINKSIIPFNPEWDRLQNLNNSTLRVPLENCYSSLYLNKDKKGKTLGTIIRVFPLDSVLGPQFSCAIIWYEIETKKQQGMMFMNGKYDENIMYTTPKTTDHTAFCWISVLDFFFQPDCSLKVTGTQTASEKKRLIRNLEPNTVINGEILKIRHQIRIIKYLETLPELKKKPSKDLIN